MTGLFPSLKSNARSKFPTIALFQQCCIMNIRFMNSTKGPSTALCDAPFAQQNYCFRLRPILICCKSLSKLLLCRIQRPNIFKLVLQHGMGCKSSRGLELSSKMLFNYTPLPSILSMYDLLVLPRNSLSQYFPT